MTISIENPTVADALKKDAIAQSIIKILEDSGLVDLECYAVVNQLNKAFDDVATHFSNKAAAFALREPTKDNPNALYELASQQKEFSYNGYFYQVLFSCDHNYGEQKINGVLDPDSVKWKACCAKIKNLSADLSSERKEKKRLEDDLCRHHSNMEALNPRKIVKFISSKSTNG